MEFPQVQTRNYICNHMTQYEHFIVLLECLAHMHDRCSLTRETGVIPNQWCRKMFHNGGAPIF